MKLNICMLLFAHYNQNMVIYPPMAICGYLSNLGHNVTQVMWGGDKRDTRPFNYNGTRVYTVPESRYLGGTSPLAKIVNLVPDTIRRMRITSRILLEEKYDVIFVSDYAFDGIIAAYNRRKRKIRFVYQLSNPLEQVWEEYKIDCPRPLFFYYLIAKFHELIQKCLLYQADLILPISKELKQHLVRQGITESKIMPWPSAVDTRTFTERDGRRIRDRYNLGNSRVVEYIGTFGKPRNLSVLIQAFSRVIDKEGTGVRLLMVGDGNDGDNLRRLAAQLGITDSVVFTGRVPQQEIPDYIAVADVAVSPVPPLPFYKMSSPTKLFEYLGMAKPVVANEEIPEQKEPLKESGGGILVPFASETFADAIIYLLDNPAEAISMGRRGRDWVVANRSYDGFALQLEQRYLELVAGGIK